MSDAHTQFRTHVEGYTEKDPQATNKHTVSLAGYKMPNKAVVPPLRTDLDTPEKVNAEFWKLNPDNDKK
jgi:hypothetical protein